MNSSQIQLNYHVQDHSGQIVLCHYDDVDIYVACNALTGHPKQTNSDGSEACADDHLTLAPIMLVNEKEAVISPKLDRYIRELTPILQERATSPLMKKTLELATVLGIQKEVCTRNMLLFLAANQHIHS